MVWLWQRGDYKGILNNNHFHSIGMLMLRLHGLLGLRDLLPVLPDLERQRARGNLLV
jgi:hypothetical protein